MRLTATLFGALALLAAPAFAHSEANEKMAERCAPILYRLDNIKWATKLEEIVGPVFADHLRHRSLEADVPHPLPPKEVRDCKAFVNWPPK